MIRIKLIITLATMICAGIGLFGNLSYLENARAFGAKPSLVVDTTSQTIDCGNQPFVVARFPLFNAGNQRLVIVEKGVCCGDELMKLVIPPGKTLTLELETIAGQKKVARFSTNDPNCPDFELTLRTTPNVLLPRNILKPVESLRQIPD